MAVAVTDRSLRKAYTTDFQEENEVAPIKAELCKENHKLNIKSLTKTRLSSQVWRFFGMLFRGNKCIDSKHIYCRQCFSAKTVKRYNASTATHSLRFHLTGKHNTSIKLVNRSDEKHVKLHAWSAQSSTATADCEKTEFHLALDLALWIARDLFPIDAICKEGFRQFCIKYNILKEDEHLPNSSMINNTALNYVYCAIHEHMLKTVLPKIVLFAISCDSWTDDFRRLSYITFNLHWISAEWELKSLCLQTAMFEHPVTCGSILNRLQSILDDYNLEKTSIVAYVSQGDESIAEAFQTLNVNGSSCVAHCISLLVKDLLTHSDMCSIQELLIKVRCCLRTIIYRHQKIINVAEISGVGLSQVLQDLEAVYRRIECDGIGMQDVNAEALRVFNPNDASSRTEFVDFGTKWMTLLAMLKSVVVNNDIIQRALEMLNVPHLIMNEGDCSLAKDIIEILETIKVTTDILHGSSYPPISVVLLLRSDISKKLKDMLETSVGAKRKAITILLENLTKRLDLCDINVCGAILDPSTQNLELVLDHLNNKEETKLEFLRRIGNSLGIWRFSDELDSHMEVDLPTTDNESPGWKKMKLEMLKRNTITAISTDSIEVEVFMYQQICEEILDPIEWWRKNSHVFPKLSKLANAILTIPAVSTQSQHIFSGLGSLHSSQILQVSPMRVQQVLFINKNYNFICS